MSNYAKIVILAEQSSASAESLAKNNINLETEKYIPIELIERSGLKFNEVIILNFI